MEGKIIHTQQQATRISLPGIATGMYLLQIRDQQGQLVQITRISVW